MLFLLKFHLQSTLSRQKLVLCGFALPQAPKMRCLPRLQTGSVFSLKGALPLELLLLGLSLGLKLVLEGLKIALVSSLKITLVLVAAGGNLRLLY